ncbi:MAG: universal stress protein [Candidatus Thermoplasmatota archaeon]|jgi:nucleotide-binding universal stress UspA family protein|nr:universal stress protein [Candidatus Thermoplasmatota archaeon]MCL5791310.1 universal stress protein [Candidatus Thermoplasmatota archaeon]
MNIELAFDNSPSAIKAINFARKMGPVCDLLSIVYVNPGIIRTPTGADTIVPEAVFTDQEKFAEKVEESVKSMMQDSGINYEFLKIDATGDEVARKIVGIAGEKKIDLIITGTRKLSGLSKFILGSVSSEIIKLSNVPVLVVPPDDST